MKNILVVTLDTLGERKAGPAIRAWEIAGALSTEHQVSLVTFGQCTVDSDAFRVQGIEVDDFRGMVEASDVVIIQGFVFNAFPWLHECEQVIVVDLYDPFHLETLEVERSKPMEKRDEAHAFALSELNAQILRGDYFLCASDKQRDLWIGHLAALGRVNPLTYDQDVDLGALLGVAPFGISPSPPIRTGEAIKGVVNGIGKDDFVMMWGGGVYNWFDPISLIAAVGRLVPSYPQLKLFFLGMKHPNPDVPEMAVATQTRALAEELGLTGTHVFFNEDWVPFEERQNYLLDADLGVSCHFQHVETAFSFRTRILDYLWAGLPVLSTQGDTFAAIVERERLGLTVPPEDVDALASAIERMLTDPEFMENSSREVSRIAESYIWSTALQPLIEFCNDPKRAADWERPNGWAVGATPGVVKTTFFGDIKTFFGHLRRGGPDLVVEKIKARLRRKKMYGG